MMAKQTARMITPENQQAENPSKFSLFLTV
jgi:hypothetical protein